MVNFLKGTLLVNDSTFDLKKKNFTDDKGYHIKKKSIQYLTPY